jgi:hypothetical protein
MPSLDIGVTDTTQATGIVGIDTVLRPSPDLTTTTTADPGSGGTTLAVTNGSLNFPTGNNFYVRVENEIMFVTAGNQTNSWTVTRGQRGTTAVAHTTGVTVSLMVAVQRVSPIIEDIVTFEGMLASFRTLGNAAAPQNIFSIENGAGSTVLLGVKRLRVEMDATALLTAVAPEFVTYRQTTLPSAGTTLTKVAVDTALTSNASVIIRGATASDGGAATAITATASANRMYHQFQHRMSSIAGQMIADDYNLIPEASWDNPVILRAGEALLVQVIGTAASNAATNHYVVKTAFREYKTA